VFTELFFLLRAYGLKVSINEWMTLMEALDRGLARASLTGFYFLCRAVLIKSEADYDKLDLAFAHYFYGVETPEELLKKLWEWLDREVPFEGFENGVPQLEATQLDLEELKKMLEERLQEQHEEHHGGNYWIGTGGTSPFGHSGYHPGGIRLHGQSQRLSAVKVAEQRRYRDFRTDRTLDARQFQMAFRKLRQFSTKDEGPRTELDLDATVDETCDAAGFLKLVWERPRTNIIKVLLLMDSGGSMDSYSELTRQLFQATLKSRSFKELKVYFFHNCIYDCLYHDPTCSYDKWDATDWVIKDLDPEYRVIVVGDASMAPSELMARGGIIDYFSYNEQPGIVWLKKLTNRFEHRVWLNPIPQSKWYRTYGAWTIDKIRKVFPMYELSVDGIEQAVKKLRVAR